MLRAAGLGFEWRFVFLFELGAALLGSLHGLWWAAQTKLQIRRAGTRISRMRTGVDGKFYSGTPGLG